MRGVGCSPLDAHLIITWSGVWWREVPGKTNELEGRNTEVARNNRKPKTKQSILRTVPLEWMRLSRREEDTESGVRERKIAPGTRTNRSNRNQRANLSGG